MKKLIPLAPNMDRERTSKALERRDQADYQCFMLLQELTDCRAHILSPCRDSLREDQDFIRRLRDAVLERRDASDEFIRAVTGR